MGQGQSVTGVLSWSPASARVAFDFTESLRCSILPACREATRMAILSINETTTFRWSFEEDITHYAAAGITAVGVWRQKLSDCGLPRAKELLSRHRMSVSHLFWAGGF